MRSEAEVQCVIIHHRQPKSVDKVVHGALSSGIAAQRIIVVDNSPSNDADLVLPAGVRYARVANHGYGAAANLGVRLLEEADSPAPLTLVASHEAEVNFELLSALLSAMQTHPGAAAAGPTLLLEGSGLVWSTGGYFTRFLRRAEHYREIDEAPGEPRDREWLDGALILYRTHLLGQFPFDESYFLYFEETDLHVRLRKAGYRILWVPTAVGHQASSGIPPRLLGRNTLLFQSRHFSAWTGRAALIFAVGRAFARKLVTGRGSWRDSQQIIAGWLSAEKELRKRNI
ncbi:hypothetical protein [Microbacterium sp.]|uniref:hypothetical protein n=1 Tax=Microbacterium sp. TaxID=51671 RepID=UPI003C707C39